MNKTYALVWNQSQRCWNAVGETARRRGKSSGGKRLAAAAVSLLGLAALPAFALPTGEALVSGNADFIRSGDGKSLSVNQHTDKLITNWQDFSVAGGERVSFHQPGSQSIALNRVIGTNGSQIHGQIDANGKVFLVNPNGVLFGSGAQINVGGLVASTQNIADADFLAGNYRFSGNSTGSVVNDGRITAADGGSVALLGARVSNNGVIHAKMGRVALGAGNAFNVNFDGSGLLNLQVEGGAVDAQAHNGGLLKADGGEVLMTARAAGNLLNAVVNNAGTIEAKGLASHGGKITLDGGVVKIAGKLDASAAEAGAPAGSILTRGQRVDVANDAQVDTRTGNTAGTWTIEAANAGVNGGAGSDRSIGADTLSRNLDTTHVALTNTHGDLTVGAPVAWNSDNALTLTSQHGNVDLQQALSAAGTNARLQINAGDKIRVNDAVKLTGRNAHLELNSNNGHVLANDNAIVTLSGNDASYRSNGRDYKVLHTVADLRNVDANLGGRYVLGNAIDGAGTNFRSIGGGHTFVGAFDGLGNTISRLSISNFGYNAVGLFAGNLGTIANLNLRNTSTIAFGSPYGSPVSVGTLAGFNMGTISNVTAKDATVTTMGHTIAGGLVGSNYNGRIERATVTGRVDGDGGALTLGGLVGENLTFPGSPTAGTIRDSHADVLVTAASGSGAAGGLVGYNRGDIESSTAAGDVLAGEHAVAGGFVGYNDEFGSILASSARGNVTVAGKSTAGGFVGVNDAFIETSSAFGKVTVGNDSTAGGFAGVNSGGIEASGASGNVIAGNASRAGGFAGDNTGIIDSSDASGDVTVGHTGNAGGFAGTNAGRLQQASATGKVWAGHSARAGGLVGVNRGTVIESSAGGSVKAGDSSEAGGLIGEARFGSVVRSTASGDVEAGTRSNVGGLVGLAVGTLDQSNATGSVKGGDYSVVGGLIGNNGATVTASSSTGTVSGGRYAILGGLAGGNFGLIGGSSTTSRVDVVAGYGQIHGPLVGVNYGQGKVID
ncbi:filamentous hemagglutinin N-terminal domain-containing protein [Burkholderia sp. Bp9125]|nr:filamentous hemagglutinin N-terminal domain-containing protein [Burkholderia sp. Bp9125]